jgi:hypothetical protein
MSQSDSSAPKGWTFKLVSQPDPAQLPPTIWRSGNQLVVYLDGPRFPPLCAWTGEEIGTELKEVEVRAQEPNAWRWRLLPLRFGYQAAFRTLVMQLPVCDRRVEEWRAAKARMGRFILTIAAVCLLPFLALFPFVWPIEDGKVVPFSLPFVLILISSVMCLAGMICGAMWTSIPGTPGPGAVLGKLTDERYLWIAGINPRFLEQLSEWPGASLSNFDFRFSYPMAFVNLCLNLAMGTFLFLCFLAARFVLSIQWDQ